jgi:hypothetical protein
MAVCSVLLTYKAMRSRCRRFRQVYANQFRRQPSKPGDKWHNEKVFLTIHSALEVSDHRSLLDTPTGGDDVERNRRAGGNRDHTVMFWWTNRCRSVCAILGGVRHARRGWR